MSHFKYEINERNLRLQLKENTIPFSEDAWLKFESFSASQKNYNHENAMKRFQLSMNRNIVLPVIFGGVIILFSFLLFNFVNIKNPNHETAETKPEPVVSTPAVTQKKPETPPVKKEEIIAVETRNTEVITTPEIVTKSLEIKTEQPETTSVAAAIGKPIIKIRKSDEQPDSGNAKMELNSAIPKIERNVAATSPGEKIETPKKKKKHKRQLIVTEPTVEEDALAPPPVSQTSGSSSGEIQ